MNTNLMPANSYYLVKQPFGIFLRVGSTDTSNTAVGRSTALCTVYLKTAAAPGGIVAHLHGGLFYIAPGACEALPACVQLDERHIFEHGGAPFQPFPLGDLEQVSGPGRPINWRPAAAERKFRFHNPASHGPYHWFGRGPVLVYDYLEDGDACE